MRTLVLPAALAICACTATPERERATSQTAHVIDTARTKPPARDSIIKLLSDYGHWFGHNRATVISRLGTPHHIATTVGRSGADTIFVLAYPNASFDLSLRNADQLETLWEIRVWAPLPGMPSVISLGATTQAALLAMIGRPDYAPPVLGDSTVLSYQWFAPYSELVAFYLVRDTVRLVRWRFRIG